MHWNRLANTQSQRLWSGGYYHQRLNEVFSTLVPQGQRVLEIGCGRGDLLAALKPAEGVGIDFSPTMLSTARQAHPELTFIEADIHSLELNTHFDYIILSDLVNDLWDVQLALENVNRLCSPHTRIIINTYSRMWELPLAAAASLGLSNKSLYQNWLTVDDISAAKAAGERWKLIGTLERMDGKLAASVKPVRLPVSHPLAGVSGASNAVHFTTDYVGEVTLIGPGAGRLPTGYAVLEDIFAIYR